MPDQNNSTKFDQVYQLNLNVYRSSFTGFQNRAIKEFSKKDFDRELYNYLPDVIRTNYENNDFSFTPISSALHSPAFVKLSLEFLKNNQEIFLGFLNVLFGELIKNFQPHEHFIDFISSPCKSSSYDLDFYFDEGDYKFKRKLDKVNTHNINTISKTLEESNQELYDSCVSEFLGFPLTEKGQSDFYHESLDKMRDVLQNILTLYYEDIKISNKDRLANILFDDKQIEFTAVVELIIKTIHHDPGERVKLNRKQYNYWWLELNKLIFLLLSYK